MKHNLDNNFSSLILSKTNKPTEGIYSLRTKILKRLMLWRCSLYRKEKWAIKLRKKIWMKFFDTPGSYIWPVDESSSVPWVHLAPLSLFKGLFSCSHCPVHITDLGQRHIADGLQDTHRTDKEIKDGKPQLWRHGLQSWWDHLQQRKENFPFL